MKNKLIAFYDSIRFLKLPWVVDPKTGEPSVSLTLALVFTGLLIGSWLMEKQPGPITEAFWGSLALYFGRKITVAVSNGKVEAESEESNK